MNNTAPRIFPLLALCVISGARLHAQNFTWVPTATGSSYNWTDAANWTPGTEFPDAPGAVANLNSDIEGAQTVRLRKDIVLGTLNIGDAAASTTQFAFTIGNASAESFSLTFDSSLANTAAQLNLNSTGNPTNVLGVPVLLNSDLNINLGTGSQILSISASGGSLSTGSGLSARDLTVTNGTAGTNQFTLLGNLTGDGVFTNNSNAAVIITNAKSFEGTFVLNKGRGGTNTGSLTVTSGSIADAAEVIINGHLSSGVTQNGGILHAGNSSLMTTNPGQRFTRNRITMNGGTMTAGGQALSGAAQNTLVQDTVQTLDFNSAYSLLSLNAAASSSGTLLNVTTLERSPGASAFVRSETLGGTARVVFGNGNSLLKGAAGAEGSTSRSIIPWMVAANDNGSASNADTFATHTLDGGIRGLVTASEYATNLAAGEGSNVSIANVSVAGDTATINALRYTNGNATNIGAGKTLVLASGGLIFTTGGTIGASGNAAAGTLQFGLDNSPTEGVIWSNGNNTNTIGASISGSGGLTKAGTGRLILTGENTFTGPSYVGGGTLQIGDGVNASNLGLTGDVTVANGATLSLFTGLAIADDAILRLEQFGFSNGKLSLESGVNETVGALFLGEMFAAAGTYGSTLSNATFQNDTFFSGSGVVTVVPEPASIGLLFGGFGMLLMRRGRRRD